MFSTLQWQQGPAAGTDPEQIVLPDGWRARLLEVLKGRNASRVSLSSEDSSDETSSYLEGALPDLPSVLLLTLGLQHFVHLGGDQLDKSIKHTVAKLVWDKINKVLDPGGGAVTNAVRLLGLTPSGFNRWDE